ncbi:hypothetical protein Acr_15g0019820 [Actinidia rufa]|uniref:RING-type domain-containing protein n=1 Tax=Actinidia rufa TaxID=165716 RepID=A0A7J0FXR5_9ERIC|nr:hypothetical protein Acr_15g0019820 [Actinidia rufa]
MGGGASSKLRRAARKIVQTCGSFSRGQSPVPVSDHHTTTTSTMSPGQPRISATPGEAAYATQPLSSTSTPKNLCAICLDPLSYGTGPSPAQAVFTAQCSHAFHFACISCNVRHASPGGQHFAPTGKTPSLCTSSSRAYLSVTLARQPATDLWFSHFDPLIVWPLSLIPLLQARVFPLKRMTSYGKRTALQVIDRIFYMGQADPIEGLKKGVKILGDCTHKNPRSSILHLSDSPTRSYHRIDMENSIPIHRFHVGFDFGTSSGFVMHEFEEFLTRALGDVIKEIQLRIGENARILRLGELRGGEERRIPLILGESGHVCVEYSYIEGGIDECIRTGEILAGTRDERERVDGTEALVSVAGRNSSVESWDYHDPYRARRWAKHLHGYRI